MSSIDKSNSLKSLQNLQQQISPEASTVTFTRRHVSNIERCDTIISNQWVGTKENNPLKKYRITKENEAKLEEFQESMQQSENSKAICYDISVYIDGVYELINDKKHGYSQINSISSASDSNKNNLKIQNAENNVTDPASKKKHGHSQINGISSTCDLNENYFKINGEENTAEFFAEFFQYNIDKINKLLKERQPNSRSETDISQRNNDNQALENQRNNAPYTTRHDSEQNQDFNAMQLSENNNSFIKERYKCKTKRRLGQQAFADDFNILSNKSTINTILMDIRFYLFCQDPENNYTLKLRQGSAKVFDYIITIADNAIVNATQAEINSIILNLTYSNETIDKNKCSIEKLLQKELPKYEDRRITIVDIIKELFEYKLISEELLEQIHKKVRSCSLFRPNLNK